MSAGSNTGTDLLSFAIIDFEASSLDENSYPIEVGLAVVHCGVINGWSSLIRPSGEWVKRDAWSRRSERVHCITREMLVGAASSTKVAAELNRRTDGFDQVYCDGGYFDAHWLQELFADADTRPLFRLADVGLLVSPDRRDRYLQALSASTAPHRAESDARRLAEAVRDSSRVPGHSAIARVE